MPVRSRWQGPGVTSSIGARLAGGFGITLLLLVCVVAVGWTALGTLAGAAQAAARDDARQVAAAGDVRAAAAAVLAAQNAYVIDGGASRRDFSIAVQQLSDALDVLSASAGQDASRALVGRMRSGLDTFRAVDEMIWQAVQAGDTVKARNLSLGPERLAYSHLISDATSYSEYALNQQNLGVGTLHRVADRARTAMLGIGLLAVLLGAAAAVRLTNSVRRPLASLEAASARAAAGDLTARVDLGPGPRADEASRLAAVFNHMVSRLHGFVAVSDFDAQLRRALEYVDTEPEVLDVIVQAATAIAPEHPLELLLADSSHAHLEQVAVSGPDPAGPACPVQMPFSCPAVRNGRATVYTDSRDLGACPKLKNRPAGPLSAACVPVTFMGRALGVVHLTAPVDTPPTSDFVERLSTLATEVGNRIGTVRAFERTHVQASTDSLTGLLNRRALEAAVRELHRFSHRYAVILADLDHFKNLNDTHGHEAGDRALRLFAQTLRDVTRPDDLISRYGGEEFVIVLPGCTSHEAIALSQRLQRHLASANADSTTPAYTFSAGIADSSHGPDLTTVVSLADTALYRAKNNGRNQTRRYDPSGLTTAELTVPAPRPGPDGDRASNERSEGSARVTTGQSSAFTATASSGLGSTRSDTAGDRHEGTPGRSQTHQPAAAASPPPPATHGIFSTMEQPDPR